MPPPRRITRFTLIAAAAAGVVVAGIAGCAPTPTPTRETPPADPEDIDQPPRQTGLEVRVWLADDADPLDALIADLEAGAGGDAEPIAGAWRRAGLRCFIVPVGRLPEFRGRVVSDAARQTRWIGQPAEPINVVSGPRHAAFDLVRTGETARPLDRGVPELVARAWVMPVRTPDTRNESIEPRLALEIAVRHDATPPSAPFVDLAPRRPPEQLLRLAASLPADRALLLLAADPDAVAASPGAPRAPARRPTAPPVIAPNVTPRPAGPDQPEPPVPAADLDLAATPATPASPNRDPGNELAGPGVPRVPTLGELLLPELPGPARWLRRRPILVFVPRVPESFGLVDPRAAAPLQAR